MRVGGRVAMVTGGGSGIGRACAMMMAKEGADIVVADIDGDHGESVAKAVQGIGRGAVALPTDTSKKDQVQRIVKAGIDRFGKIDILVNAAGIPGGPTVRDMPEELFDRVLAVHLKSTFLCSQAVLDSMMAQRWGRIVNITSRAAWKGRAGSSVYAAAKAGMTGFSRCLAVEVGPYGITVNNVAPGFVVTPMTSTQGRFATEELQVKEQERLGAVAYPLRFCRPEEIAEAVLYFCGPNSGQTTGATLHVNSGTVMS